MRRRLFIKPDLTKGLANAQSVQRNIPSIGIPQQVVCRFTREKALLSHLYTSLTRSTDSHECGPGLPKSFGVIAPSAMYCTVYIEHYSSI